MNVVVDVICFKSKVLANQEHPLMLRVTKNRKRKYKSIGVSINPKYWDFNKNKPKRNCPDKELIQQLITERVRSYREQILEYKIEDKDFTAKSLIDKVNTSITAKTVQDLFNLQIEHLLDSNRRNYALSYKQLMNSLLSFNNHLDIYFSDIDVTWLKGYESWLRKSALKENTIGIRFRTLRAIYNLAIEEKVVKKEYYPFDAFKVSKLHQATVKRALSKQDIVSIINYHPEMKQPYTELAIDLFTFSYLVGGINFVDMAHLRQENLIENRLVYTRRKTKKLIKLPLQPKAMKLINKHSNSSNPYLFPILNKFHVSEVQKANRVHKVIAKVNKCLKTIGEELEIPIDLTTYVARHSYATVLKRSGVATSIISESLGHSSERVTQIYLDSFENSQIDEAMSNLL